MIKPFKPFALMILFSGTLISCGSASKPEKPEDLAKTKNAPNLNKRYRKTLFLLYFPKENKSIWAEKYFLENSGDKDTITVVPCKMGAPAASPDSATIRTKAGEQYHCWLDKANIFVNAATTLRINENLQGKKEFDLKGECFIETKKKNCTVTIDSIGIRVSAGSKINMMGYENEPGITITLISGSADVSAPGHHFTMNRHLNKLSFLKGAAKFSQTATASEGAEVWTEGILYGERLPCSYVFRCMERLYAKNFVWQGSDSSCDKTFLIPYRDMSLRDVLEEIKTQFKLYPTVSSDTIFLHEKSSVK